MPPVTRYHTGTLVVPGALLDAIWSAFDGFDDILYAEETLAYRLVCAYGAAAGPVEIDAGELSDARNTLDAWTLSTECGTRSETWRLAADCDFCLWCQALVMRDWCDELLDRAGFTARSAWIETTTDDADSGALYERMWRVVNETYAAAAAPGSRS